MEFSKKELEEFKEAYRHEGGRELSEEEALVIAQRLLGFLLLIYRPLPEGNEPEDENPDADF